MGEEAVGAEALGANTRDADVLEEKAKAKAEVEAKAEAGAKEGAKAEAKAEAEAKAGAKAEAEAEAKAGAKAGAKAKAVVEAKAEAEAEVESGADNQPGNSRRSRLDPTPAVPAIPTALEPHGAPTTVFVAGITVAPAASPASPAPAAPAAPADPAVPAAPSASPPSAAPGVPAAPAAFAAPSADPAPADPGVPAASAAFAAPSADPAPADPADPAAPSASPPSAAPGVPAAPAAPAAPSARPFSLFSAPPAVPALRAVPAAPAAPAAPSARAFSVFSAPPAVPALRAVPAVPAARGGRRAAEARLASIDPARYGASRNHLEGAVTRLSPYIRHGVLTLAEVREAVFARLRERGGSAADQGPLQGTLFGDQEPAGAGLWSPAQRRAGEKLIAELGWRDYWQRLWRLLGDGIWHDREPLKTGHAPASYAPRLPADLTAAATGLPCMDAFAAELMGTGWLHNHARMWLAAYVVHWRRVRWQAGASWFLRHLLDGDPASNNLSWQWVASAFSHKPYIFNRANLERFSSGRFCATCPAAHRGGADQVGGCPFEASYDRLQARLFGPPAQMPPPAGPAVPVAPAARLSVVSGPPPRRPLVWVHGEALGPANPALRAHPAAPALFVWDAELIAGRTPTTADPRADGAEPLASGRLRFLRECLQELPVEVREGDVAAELLAAAAAIGADAIVTSQAVDPRFGAIARRLEAALPLRVLEPEPFVALPVQGPGAPDLRRFSRYWRLAEPLVWGERG